MKKTFLLAGMAFLLLSICPAIAQQTLNIGDKEPLEEWLQSVEPTHKVRFFYQKKAIKNIKAQSAAQVATVEEGLAFFLAKTGLTFQQVPPGHYFIVAESPTPPTKSKTPEKAPKRTETPSVVTIGQVENAVAGTVVTLKGKVKDAQSEEVIPGCPVLLDGGKGRALTNANGEFEVTTTAGKHQLRVKSVGYTDYAVELNLYETGQLEVLMFEGFTALGEVTVSAESELQSPESTQMGRENISLEKLKSIPPLLGEVDVVRSMLLLPGVTSVGEGSGGFNVRGGDVGQNLVLLDGLPIFNTSHFFGFFSTFHPDMIDNATLHRGGIPAEFGGRLSSVLEVTLKEGNAEKFKGKGGIGLVASRLGLEGPLFNKNGTFHLGGRTTYSDWMLRQIPDEQVKNSAASFYDVTLKATQRFGANNKVSLTAYHSDDSFRFDQDTSYAYGQWAAALKWNTKVADGLFLDVWAGISHYGFRIENPVPTDAYRLNASFQSASVKADFLQQLSGITLKYGVQYERLKFAAGDLTTTSGSSSIIPIKVQPEQGESTSAHFSIEKEFGARWKVSTGLRYTLYRQLGEGREFTYAAGRPLRDAEITDTVRYAQGETMAFYQAPEPRVSVRYSLTGKSSLKFGYQYMRQYNHLISNSTAVTPIDFWKSSSDFLAPQGAHQVSAGYFTTLKGGISFSSEVYYKTTEELIEYKNGAKLLLNQRIEEDLVQGKGRAYGLELSLRKDNGRFTGWINYSLSKAERLVNGPTSEETVSRGKWYPSDFDRRHVLNVVANYKLSRRWSVSGNFVFNSGRPYTKPDYQYFHEGISVPFFSERNQGRIPPIHRLDVAITLLGNHRKSKLLAGNWIFSVYNLYGRKNPYSVFYGLLDGQQSLAAYRLAVFGRPFPSLTYSFEF